MEKVGMRGRLHESELVETPPHRAEFRFSAVLAALSPRAGRGKPCFLANAASVKDDALASGSPRANSSACHRAWANTPDDSCTAPRRCRARAHKRWQSTVGSVWCLS